MFETINYKHSLTELLFCCGVACAHELTCDQAFFFLLEFFSDRKLGKSAERKRKICLIYLFVESSAAPQLTNLSTATSRHFGFHASVKAATGSQAA